MQENPFVVFRRFHPPLDIQSNANLLADARCPISPLNSEYWRIRDGAGVGYSRRGKPRGRKPCPRHVAAIIVSVLSIQAGAEDVGLDLPAYVIESVNTSIDEKPTAP